MSSFKWTRELIKQLIILTEQQENLYNYSHQDYKNKIKRQQSIYKIVEELKKCNPKITREHVKSKLTSLRTQFQRERRKVLAEESKKNGTGEEGRYSPTLWCFKDLSFLKSHPKFENQKKAETPITLKPILELPASSVPVSLSSSFSFSTHSPAPQITPSTPSPHQHPPPPTPQDLSDHLFAVPSAPAPQIGYTPPFKKIKLSSPVSRDQENHMCAKCPCIETQESEYEKIGKTWGSELRKMTAQQQIFAKRAIAEILFEGQLGTLHRNSVMISHVEDVYDSPHHDPLNTERTDECL